MTQSWISICKVSLLTTTAVLAIGNGYCQSSPILAKNIGQVRYADQFLSTASGDIGQAVNLAFQDCGNSCRVEIPAGVYTTFATPIHMNTGEVLCGHGSANTTLIYSGTGNAIAITTAPGTGVTDPNDSYVIGTNGARVCDLTLVGNGVATAGIQLQDVIGTILEDLHITGFTSGAGIWMKNQGAWTERTSITKVNLGKDNGGNLIGLRISQNPNDFVNFGNGSVFVNSFGYSKFLDIRMNVGSGQRGIQIESLANLYHSTILASFNLEGSNATAVYVQSGATAQWNTITFLGEGSSDTRAIVAEDNAIFEGSGYSFFDGAVNQISGSGRIALGANTVVNALGQFQPGSHTVADYVIGSGTETVTLSGDAVFHSFGYKCSLTYRGPAAVTMPITYQIISGNQFIVTGQPYIGIDYVCTGY